MQLEGKVTGGSRGIGRQTRQGKPGGGQTRDEGKPGTRANQGRRPQIPFCRKTYQELRSPSVVSAPWFRPTHYRELRSPSLIWGSKEKLDELPPEIVAEVQKRNTRY